MILSLARGTQDLALKQWVQGCRLAEKGNVGNPLFSEDQELELLPDSTLHAVIESESEDENSAKPGIVQTVY